MTGGTGTSAGLREGRGEMLRRGVCWIREVREGFLEEVGYELDLEIPARLEQAGHSVTWEWARPAQVQGLD